MNKEKWLYLLVGVLFVLYVLVEFYSPKPIDWTITFHHNDKKPYGAYVLYHQFPRFYSGKISDSYNTLYELQDSTGHVVILADGLQLNETDIEVLLEKVTSGTNVFIGAQFMEQNFLDTLGLDMELRSGTQFFKDSVEITYDSMVFSYPASVVQSWFEPGDSSQWTSLVQVGEKPILVSRAIGQGRLILCSAPLLFSNFSVLHDPAIAEYALNLLPEDQDLQYTQFYQLGKPRSESPFRYILTQEALTWALYLGLFIIIAFLVINSQRRQRAVPVIPPLQNTSVHFIKTIGALFYREKNHHSVAEKLISHFYLKLHQRYYQKPGHEERYYEFLSHKTGIQKSEVIRIFEHILAVQQRQFLRAEQLEHLYKDLNKIN